MLNFFLMQCTKIRIIFTWYFSRHSKDISASPYVNYYFWYWSDIWLHKKLKKHSKQKKVPLVRDHHALHSRIPEYSLFELQLGCDVKLILPLRFWNLLFHPSRRANINCFTLLYGKGCFGQTNIVNPSVYIFS